VPDEAASRRERLAVKAYDPATGGEIEVFISYDRLRAFGNRTKGQILDAAVLVPQALQCREAVFEVLRREVDEPKHEGTGWRCYCCCPDRSFAEDGEILPPRRERVFLVFVNDQQVAYNWRWERADPDHPSLPLDSENRFKRRLA